MSDGYTEVNEPKAWALPISCPEYCPPPRAPVPATSHHRHFLPATLPVTTGTLPRCDCALRPSSSVSASFRPARGQYLRSASGWYYSLARSRCSTVVVLPVRRLLALRYHAIAPDFGDDSGWAPLVGSSSDPGCIEGYMVSRRGGVGVRETLEGAPRGGEMICTP